eukprot:TRINITY_DN4498_c0_g1_i1.p1 TRINITY_DN4498_c0_g1~~TRINITY_DN4498_c0_g1_i1.p1  ORF type:complete len:197 (-),score=15.07 TRINITY_DN4498_c0_g1_i1:208-798(-)
MSLTRLQEATGKTGLLGIVKQAGLSIVLDGNWLETATMLSGGTSTKLIGEDALGNKYYEDVSRMYGRHRWVVYKDIKNYNASSVHPQWHAWLHCISDENPATHPPQKRKYDIEYYANPSDTPAQYLPKGSWVNPAQRTWLKTQFWTPPSAAPQLASGVCCASSDLALEPQKRFLEVADTCPASCHRDVAVLCPVAT